jgi:ubiquinone/menaquinone biosynthesis C-methylase UbiE
MSEHNAHATDASSTTNQPSPALIFETLQAYQRSAALKGAIELDVFSQIAQGHATAPQIAGACQASERGIRILCDYLVIIGILSKSGDQYALTPDSALFLDRNSPACMGNAVDFLLAPTLNEAFKDVAAVVRKGGTLLPDQGSVSPDHPVWVDFARAMAPLMAMPAQLIAQQVQVAADRPIRVLDIAAGHGLFGIVFAQHHPNVEVTALDWPGVLAVAQENAQKAGVAGRYHLLPGSAFDVDYGSDYDLVLITNFLHHFDPSTNENLLRKIHASLGATGRAVTLEFVPNDDRVSPPIPAAFSMTMLGTTPSGDAYTFAEFERMFSNAGFARSEMFALPMPEQVIVSYKS